MTADRLSEQPDHESVGFSRSSITSGDVGMDASCSSCLASSPVTPSSSPSLECPGDRLGPTPGAAPSCGDQPNDQVVSSGDGAHLPQKVLSPSEQLSLKWTQVHGVGAGLKNLGNTCFLNSVLQCLTYTPPLANYMLSGEHSKTCLETGFCMMCIMQKHVIKVFAKSGSVIQPAEVLSELPNIAKHLRHGHQEDAHEFLQHAVGALQQSCPPEETLESQTQPTTFIHQVFSGCLRSRVSCLNCRSVSDTFELFLDLPLDIERASSVSSALKQFVRPEHLGDAYMCSRCKNKVAALKTVTIDRKPNVLTLLQKRFDFSGKKVSKRVKYPENIDLRRFTSEPEGDPLIYSLYAVLVHSGFTCNKGHYFCYVKASDGQWYKMNDLSVSVSNIQTVLKQQAYILFYIKSDAESGRAAETRPLKKKKRRRLSEEQQGLDVVLNDNNQTRGGKESQKRHYSDMKDSEWDIPPEKRCCRDNWW